MMDSVTELGLSLELNKRLEKEFSELSGQIPISGLHFIELRRFAIFHFVASLETHSEAHYSSKHFTHGRAC